MHTLKKKNKKKTKNSSSTGAEWEFIEKKKTFQLLFHSLRDYLTRKVVGNWSRKLVSPFLHIRKQSPFCRKVTQLLSPPPQSENKTTTNRLQHYKHVRAPRGKADKKTFAALKYVCDTYNGNRMQFGTQDQFFQNKTKKPKTRMQP